MNKLIVTLALLLLWPVCVLASQDQTYKINVPVKYSDGIKTGDFVGVDIHISVLDQGSTAPSPAANKYIVPLLDVNSVNTGAYAVITATPSVLIPSVVSPVYDSGDAETGLKLSVSVTSGSSGDLEVLDQNGAPTGTFVKINITNVEND